MDHVRNRDIPRVNRKEVDVDEPDWHRDSRLADRQFAVKDRAEIALRNTSDSTSLYASSNRNPDPLGAQKSEVCEKVVYYTPFVPLQEILNADTVIIRRSWRSLPLHWFSLALLSYLAVRLSVIFPASVLVSGIDLSFVGISYFIELSLPFFIIPAALVVIHAFIQVYNRRIELDMDQLVYYRGTCSLMREVAEMETGTMQVVTVKQKPWEALFGVGNVSLGRFSRRMTEFDMYGVANPQRLGRILKLYVRIARERAKAGKSSIMDKEKRLVEKEER